MSDNTPGPTLDQPVLIAHATGFEYVSVALAHRIVTAGFGIPVTPEGRALLTTETEPCRNCQEPIVLEGDRWVHATPDGLPLIHGRGCRSASFSRDGDWNDEFDRRWIAAPQKR